MDGPRHRHGPGWAGTAHNEAGPRRRNAAGALYLLDSNPRQALTLVDVRALLSAYVPGFACQLAWFALRSSRTTRGRLSGPSCDPLVGRVALTTSAIRSYAVTAIDQVSMPRCA
ncbi:hypothetical protein [Streptomyces sp. NRRL S-350]|uniref:hypothetical protein n=1 Tax=Streptomyces sp. NRRL S-350 TaxID=1463902 RepID=UPI00131B9938|nr:hypothetical protein [Streptomyces sp. NRRL S-350]